MIDPPWFTRSVPAIEDPALGFTAPLMVTLLNATPAAEVTVPVPANTTVPVPPVKVAEPFAKVEAFAIVSTPPAVITIEPPLVSVLFTVSVPAAPKVSELAVRIVKVFGLFATTPFAVTA